MLNRQTTLDLNGPILSIVTNPVSVNVGCAVSGIATFVGLATASFPTQTPSNSVTPTGSVSYQWYLESYGALTDGAIAGLGVGSQGEPGVKKRKTATFISFIKRKSNVAS